MPDWKSARFAFAWLLPLAVAAGAWVSPWAAWGALLGQQILLALAERVPALQHSPPPTPQTRWHRACLWLHLPIQAALLALGLWLVVTRSLGPWEVAALALAVGGVCGTQGITYAHELGHSKSRADRVLAWVLMSSVNYAHFMVEHYRGHHPLAATP